VRRLLSLLFFPGVALVVFGVGVLHSVHSEPHYTFGHQNSLWAYALFALLHGLSAHTAGIPDEAADMQPALLASMLASGIATSIWLLVQTIVPGLLPRWVVLLGGVGVALWSYLLAALSVMGRRREQRRDRVLAVLDEHDAEILERDSASTFPRPERAFGLVDVLTSESRLRDLDARLEEADCTVIVLSDSAARRDDVFKATSRRHRQGLKVRTLSDFYAEYFGKLPVSEMSRMALLFDIRDLHNPVYRHLKRTVDFTGGLVAGVACLLATPFVFVGNRVANPGPMLFRQTRVGRDGRSFTILKFRSMQYSALQGLSDIAVGSWTRVDDPRITPFGRFLRRTHVDELPQAWNILRGDLSLVGPRPEQPHYVADLIQVEPAFEIRQYVTPGLTGWAQVKYRYAATEAAALEKLQYDLYYIAEQSLSLDLRILSRTIRSVLRRRGL
jgi:lipopolysaccharide/colanic/teichoic acid biosynthesis glycosyltransferase